MQPQFLIIYMARLQIATSIKLSEIEVVTGPPLHAASVSMIAGIMNTKNRFGSDNASYHLCSLIIFFSSQNLIADTIHLSLHFQKRHGGNLVWHVYYHLPILRVVAMLDQ